MNENITIICDALKKGNRLSYDNSSQQFKAVGKLEYIGRCMKQLFISKITKKDYLANCKMETVAKGIQTLVDKQNNSQATKTLEEIRSLKTLNARITLLTNENSIKKKKEVSQILKNATETLLPIISSYQELKKIQKECRAISEHLQSNKKNNEPITFSLFIDRGNAKNIVSNNDDEKIHFLQKNESDSGFSVKSLSKTYNLGPLGQKNKKDPSPYDHFEITKNPSADENPFTFKIVNFSEEESSIKEEEVKKLAQQYTDMLNSLCDKPK